MFTGLIEETGTMAGIRKGAHSAVLTIRCSRVLSGTKVGDSIAVNGVCLTVTALGSGTFSADVMHETLNRSSLGALKPGSRVNLERAMPADGRFGGHIVAGHVDGTGTVKSIKKDDNAVWYTVSAAPQVLRYIVEKGSVTIDGISLTVAGADSTSFSVSVIPHTAAATTLPDRKPGDIVNLENDIIGKYVEKLLGYIPAPACGEPEHGGAFSSAAPQGQTLSGRSRNQTADSCEIDRNRTAAGGGCGKNPSSAGITRDMLAKYGF